MCEHGVIAGKTVLQRGKAPAGQAAGRDRGAAEDSMYGIVLHILK